MVKAAEQIYNPVQIRGETGAKVVPPKPWVIPNSIEVRMGSGPLGAVTSFVNKFTNKSVNVYTNTIQQNAEIPLWLAAQIHEIS